MEKRLAKARSELGKASLFDYVVTNDSVEAAAGLIQSIIRAERSRYKRQAGIEEALIHNE